MGKWIDLPQEEMQVLAFQVAEQKNITEGAVEKDWWVTAVLKALFSLPVVAKYLSFKGGTSLSKGWDLINRFSEDIDLALDRNFYLNERKEDCAKTPNNNQIKNLRKLHRSYVINELSNEIKDKLYEMGFTKCIVYPITVKEDGTAIDSDSDPVTVEVHYPVKVQADKYVSPVVKIEISCLSMKEPIELKSIKSLIGAFYPLEDDEMTTQIPTVLPSRTFLEKSFPSQRRIPKGKSQNRKDESSFI